MAFRKPFQSSEGSSSGPRGASKGPRKFGDKKRDDRRGGPGGGRFFQKKVCRFCADRTTAIDFKDVEKLRKFLTEKGKIMPRRITGNCAKCQRMLARAIKRSRHSAFVAFQID
jgi:small subunit ribosomal protein S18